ncbi:hypothetical protein SNOG_14945 [Parastagonospora nodorum SN15]|uniref:Uncharacterized protein n=1 Tax=Phaeosphaeria nodorum (strain SN15 / ATCC MYA-4574 / FGSC 10173) TaxID=321614 RepID=Q0U097_PHANO|nr:hypothetical protein SNOG_14945 [Parastagonospora nodorum SN15]EAT77797.1 hypothetical protein SNOG_14945 [Parastagonospora nodorum SN15]
MTLLQQPQVKLEIKSTQEGSSLTGWRGHPMSHAYASAADGGFLEVDVDILEIRLPCSNVPNAPFGQQNSLLKDPPRSMSGSGYSADRLCPRIPILDWSSLCVEQSVHKPHCVVTLRKLCARGAKADAVGSALGEPVVR